MGRIIERVMVDGLDPQRLDNLFVIGVDEASGRASKAAQRGLVDLLGSVCFAAPNIKTRPCASRADDHH